ncbi:MAG TPA: MaoC family dehydratase [Bryobacteraceae bacterium]|jgi:acyl dehydratase|nr:MaoC family dehydratase [Bryobacteraceae bacterium]
MRIEEVKASIGREAGVSEWLEVTEDLIDAFATLTGDRQWIHVDAERARRESPFGTTIAHGFLTVALLSRLVSQAVNVEMESKLRVNYGFNRLRFPAPVPAGSRIRARVTPNAVRDVEGGIEIAWGVLVEVENQVKPALAAEWLVRTYV